MSPYRAVGGRYLFMFGLLPLMVNACTPVKAWERGTLAKPAMSLEVNPLEAHFLNHLHESKEGSKGGYGVGGGGCGCG